MDKIAEIIANVNGKINDVVWGIPMLALLLGAGLFLTLRSGAVQFTHFGHAMRNTVGKIFHKVNAGKGAVTPFQAMTTALAATVGTGNIVGVSQAIAMGGPGAVFWMWVAALVGMCTKYSEVVLAVRFRQRNKHGDWVGGPMYYITNGLGKGWKWLAVIFCAFGALAAFGIGNIAQGNNIASSINTAITAFVPSAAEHSDTINLVLGFILAALLGLVILGGLKRLGAVTEKLIPFMSVVYIIASLVVVFANIGSVGSVFAAIFKGAFNPPAVVGGVVGFTIARAITWGCKRGVFSNEAGLGSAPIAHAAAHTSDPVKQGLYGIFEVFMDTIVICSLTALALLSSGADIVWGVKPGSELMTQAFATVYGDKLAAVILAVSITLFAFSTILSWAFYGKRCCEFMFGDSVTKLYQILFVIVAVMGATMDLGLAWDISDTLNGLMAIPNLVALLGLSGVVVKLTRDYFKSKTLKR